MGLCLGLGLAILAWNPNFRWLEQREVPYGADFLQEWTAGQMLLSGAGAEIYESAEFQARQHDPTRVGFQWPKAQFYPAVYPPPYFLIVSPLALLPYRYAAMVWLFGMLGLYAAAVLALERGIQARHSTKKDGAEAKGSIPWFWFGYLLLPGLFLGLVMGQKGTLWLFLAAASWNLWQARRPMAAGWMWSLLSLKPTLCIWLPLVMLMHRQWRFGLGVGAGVVCVWGGAWLFLPPEMWEGFSKVVSGAASYKGQAGYRVAWSCSLMSLFTALGCGPESCGPESCGPAVSRTLWLVSFAVIMISLRQRAKESLSNPCKLFQILIATALLSPHFYFYDLVWMALPLRLLWDTHRRLALFWLSILWLGMLAAQSLPLEFPMMSLVLAALFAHSLFAGVEGARPSQGKLVLRRDEICTA